MFNKIFVIGFLNSRRINNFFDIFRNFNVELIEAVDGKKITGYSGIKSRRSPECRPETNEFYDLFKLPSGDILGSQHNMTVMEVACALSHQKAHKKIIEENLNNTLILEDDVYPSAGIELLNNISLDFDFDVLMLNKTLSTKLEIIPFKADTICAYVVKNPQASNRYLNCFQKGLFVSDHPMSNPNCDLSVFCSTRPFFYHDNSTSIIDSRGVNSL